MNIDNPYVGPRAFTEREANRFFGRQREARDLLARVVSERLLLFYAQSGAGKSSLLHTRLIPGLRDHEGFQVLPVGRVSGALPAGAETVDNIYLFNLLASLEQSGGASAALAERLAHVTLPDFLARLAGERTTDADGNSARRWIFRPDAPAAPPLPAGSGPRFALIIDQFEEIISTHPERWAERADFFRQLDAALRTDPNLWIVLTLREDYVASLDPYAALVTNKLQARYRMERMDVAAALEAVRRPAALGGRPFAPGVAETLVDDLRQIRLTGQAGAVPGQYVEPVQLQVVCYQLWERLHEARNLVSDRNQVSQEDLAAAGDVDRALEEFYAATLAAVTADPAVVAAGVSERSLRTWFDKELITPSGIRSIVLRNEGSGRTGSLPNAAVDALSQRFLLRTELRGGGAWVELVHDRFVEPIRASNEAWFAEHLSTLQRAAALWQDSGRASGLLLADAALDDAVVWASTHALLPYEQEFLDASLQLRAAAERERKLRKRISILAIAASIGLIVAIVASILAGISTLRAQEQAALAVEAQATAVASAAEAEQAARRALAENLAGQSQLLIRADNRPGDLALILALNAVVTDPTANAYEALSFATSSARWRQTLPPADRRHQGDVRSTAFSPDGRRVVSGGDDGTIRIWRASDLEPQQLLFGHEGSVRSVGFSPDGAQIVSGGDDGTVRIWDAASGQQAATLAGHEGSVSSVGFSPDGAQIVSGGDDGAVRIWDAASGEQTTNLTGHEGGVRSVAYSPDGAQIVSGGDDSTVRIWDAASGQQTASLAGHACGQLGKCGVRSVAYSPDGAQIVSGGADGTVRIWDAASGEQTASLAGHEESVSSVAYSPDGVQIVSGGTDGTVRIWDAASGQQTASLAGHERSVSSVAYSPDGVQIVSGGDDGTVRIWDAASGQQTASLAGHERWVSSVAYSPDGAQIVSGGDDGTVRIWDAASSQQTASLTGDEWWVSSVAYSPDGAQIVSSGTDGTVRIWDAASGQQTAQLDGHEGRVSSVAYSPNGRQIVSGGTDGTVRIWDAASGQQTASLTGHEGGVLSVEYSPDGRQIASGGDDGTVRIWDAASHQQTASLAGHEGRVLSVAYSPDGRQIASGGDDSTVRIWDAASGEQTANLSGHACDQFDQCGVNSVAYSPDGGQIVSGGDDDTVRIWDSPQQAQFKAITRISRPAPILTAAERQQFGVGSVVELPGQTILKPLMAQAAAWKLVQQGRTLAQQSDVAGAVASFKAAQVLDPSQSFEPEAEAERIYAAALVARGRTLAQQGDIAGAVASFKAAQALGLSLSFEQEAEALLATAATLAQDGDIPGAVIRYRQALDLDPILATPPPYLQVFCALGVDTTTVEGAATVCAAVDVKVATIAPGETVTAVLVGGSVDLWQFEAAFPITVTIDLRDDDSPLDAYLTLYAPDGSTLAENDDSVGTDARIVAALPENGRYLIAASGFAESSGAYRLTLTLAGAEP